MNAEQTSKKQEKKLESKIESSLKEKNDYVLFRNMTGEDIKKLDRVRIDLVKAKNKKQSLYYQLVIKFSDRLKVNVQITSTLYYLVIDRLKLEDKIGIHSLISFCRVLKGLTEETNEEWARFELFITDEVKIKQFFTSEEWALFKKEIMRGTIKINVVNSEVKLTEDEVDDFFDLAFGG